MRPCEIPQATEPGRPRRTERGWEVDTGSEALEGGTGRERVLDADVIARGISGFDPERVAFAGVPYLFQPRTWPCSVAERVRMGGHSVPEVTVRRRRYQAGFATSSASNGPWRQDGRRASTTTPGRRRLGLLPLARATWSRGSATRRRGKGLQVKTR